MNPSQLLNQTYPEQQEQKQTQRKRSRDTEEDEEEDDQDLEPRFKGVSQHKRSGRWEAHIWLSGIQKQAYLGGFDSPQAAAEAYDMIALKAESHPSQSSSRRKAKSLITNFNPQLYVELLESWADTTVEEAIVSVRRQSKGFSRGSSSFRGVTLHPSGKFEARVGLPVSRSGSVSNKHVYLGLHDDEESAARAYDGALVRMKGPKAATNFPLSHYAVELSDFQDRESKEEEGVPEVGSREYSQWVRQGESS